MTRPSIGRRLRVAVALLPLMAGGCAYFNGIYNAREAEQSADRLMKRGNEEAARGAYLTSAAKAETVLVRHRKTRWRPTALYLAGRGGALGGDCAHAIPRLQEYLALAGEPVERRDRAEIALASCEMRAGRLREARARLGPLAESRQREIARDAALWAARTEIQLGDLDAALRHLQRVDAAAAQWELAGASIEVGEWTRAESLLVIRAGRGDYRETALDAISALWAAGRADEAEAIVRRYDRAGAAAAPRVRLHLRVADLAMASGRDSLAQQHLLSAMELSRDASVDHESAARLMLVRIAQSDSLEQIRRWVEGARREAEGTAMYRRVADNLLLVDMLRSNSVLGTGTFLAAEVVRDSLRAPKVAHALFLKVGAEESGGRKLPVAATALLAAADLMPDSAAIYKARVKRDYGGTPAALILDGEDPSTLPMWRVMDDQFRAVWTRVTRLQKDSLTRLRPGGVDPGARAGQNP